MERRLRGCGGWPLGLGFLSVPVVFALGAYGSDEQRDCEEDSEENDGGELGQYRA